MDDSPLQYLDYDVTRYLYETYFPTQKTRFNYNSVIQQFKRLMSNVEKLYKNKKCTRIYSFNEYRY